VAWSRSSSLARQYTFRVKLDFITSSFDRRLSSAVFH